MPGEEGLDEGPGARGGLDGEAVALLVGEDRDGGFEDGEVGGRVRGGLRGPGVEALLAEVVLERLLAEALREEVVEREEPELSEALVTMSVLKKVDRASERRLTVVWVTL